MVGALAGCEFGIPDKGWGKIGAAAGPDGMVEWCVLDAQWFGVPQRRRRVFLVRDSGDWTSRPPVLFERHSLQGHPPPSREKRQDATSATGTRTFECGGIGSYSSSSSSPLLKSGADLGHGCEALIHCADIAHATTTHQAKGGDPTTDNYVAHSLRGEGVDASEDGTGRGTPLVPVVAEPLMAGSSNPAAHGKKNGTDRETLMPVAVPPAPTIAIRTAQTSSNGCGINDEGTSYTLDGAQGQAIAFDCKASGQNGFGIGEIASTMRSMGHAGSHQNGGGHQAVMTLAIRGRDGAPQLEVREDGTANAILTPNGGRAGIGVGAVAFAQNTRDEVREMAVVGALASQPGMKQTSYIRNAMQVRRLTPRECERLQGFPDDYTLIPFTHGKPAADGPRYKALGNSMAVPVMRWIGERIQLVDWLHS